MQPDLDKLRALLELLIEKDIAEFEHEDETVRFKIVRGARASAPAYAPSPVAISVGGASAVNVTEAASDTIDITSPFVGTFYRAPSPDVPPFVDVGSVVRAGQPLCIIEAMKLMNEIEADGPGTIVEVYAQNGRAVEFGQKLFRLKKA